MGKFTFELSDVADPTHFERGSITKTHRGWCIDGMRRSSGHMFKLQWAINESEPHLRCGCRYMTISEANLYYNDAYVAGTATPRQKKKNRMLCLESRAIISALIGYAKARHFFPPDYEVKWSIEPPKKRGGRRG